MTSNTNSISRYREATLNEIQEAGGITRFLPSSTEWYQTINGILIQGGISPSIPGNTLSSNIPFNAGFPQQVLGIFAQPIDTAVTGTGTLYSHAISVVDLNNFKIANDAAAARTYYWWAIGV